MGTKKILVIVGAVALVISFFLPYLSVFGFGVSLFDTISMAFSAGMSLIPTILAILTGVLAIVALVFVFTGKPYSRMAQYAGVLGVVVSLWNVVTSGDIGMIFGLLGIGYWIFLVASIVLIVGGSMKE